MKDCLLFSETGQRIIRAVVAGEHDPIKLAQLSNYRCRKDEAEIANPQFARYYLMRLGIRDDLQCVALDPKHPLRLAAIAEIRALFLELRS